MNPRICSKLISHEAFKNKNKGHGKGSLLKGLLEICLQRHETEILYHIIYKYQPKKYYALMTSDYKTTKRKQGKPHNTDLGKQHKKDLGVVG